MLTTEPGACGFTNAEAIEKKILTRYLKQPNQSNRSDWTTLVAQNPPLEIEHRTNV